MDVMTLGPEPVATGRNGDAIYNPMTGPLPTSGWKAARVTVELFNGDSNFTLRAFYEVSDDGLTWTDHQVLGQLQTSDGTKVGSGTGDGFETLSNAVGKRFLRFGVESNDTDNRNRLAYAALRVERRNY